MAETEKYQIEYVWDITFILLSSKNRKKDITFKPKMLKNITKTCNYDRDFMPRFKLVCTVEDEYLNILYENQDELICNIKCKKMLYEGNISDTGEEDAGLISEEIYFESNYIPLFERGLPKKMLPGNRMVDTETGKVPERDEEAQTDNQIASNFSTLECSLFDLDDRKFNKYIINDHFIEATVGTGVIACIKRIKEKDSTVLKNGIIMDPPDNVVQYKDMWILPNNFNKAIRELQRRYGIYLYGLQMFLDNGLLYILRKYDANHEYSNEQSPYTKIKLFQKPGTVKYPFIVEVDKKNENVASYMASGQINEYNSDIATSEAVFDRIAFTNSNLIAGAVTSKDGKADSGNPMMLLKKPSLGHRETGTKLMVEYDDLNNAFNLFELLKSGSTHTLLSITVGGANPEDFVPNKKIVLEIGDDEEKNAIYNGSYCINSVIFSYVPKPQNDKSFETQCTAMLVISKV